MERKWRLLKPILRGRGPEKGGCLAPLTVPIRRCLCSQVRTRYEEEETLSGPPVEEAAILPSDKEYP